MDSLTSDDLIRLAEEAGGIHITVFLPTHRGGPQTVRNRVRLKNLLREARRALAEDGMRPGQVDEVFDLADRLLDDRRLVEQASDGLAVFIGPEGLRTFRVPLRLPELVTVGARFLVRPLLPLLTAGGQFYVLALSQDELRLLRGTRFTLDEVELDGLPLGMLATMPRRRPQVHAFLADRGGSGRRTVFHGGGDEGDKALSLQHYRRVDQALRDVFRSARAPLVLAGVRSSLALYRQANTYSELLADGLDGSAMNAGPRDLHRRAWPLVEPVLRGQEAAAASTYRTLQGTGRTNSDPGAVLEAAQQGRVETLFLSTDAPGWGMAADATRLVRLGDPPDQSEQLDLAAVDTLRSGGSVYAVAAARMPSDSPVAATLRY